MVSPIGALRSPVRGLGRWGQAWMRDKGEAVLRNLGMLLSPSARQASGKGACIRQGRIALCMRRVTRSGDDRNMPNRRPRRSDPERYPSNPSATPTPREDSPPSFVICTSARDRAAQRAAAAPKSPGMLPTQSVTQAPGALDLLVCSLPASHPGGPARRTTLPRFTDTIGAASL